MDALPGDLRFLKKRFLRCGGADVCRFVCRSEMFFPQISQSATSHGAVVYSGVGVDDGEGGAGAGIEVKD